MTTSEPTRTYIGTVSTTEGESIALPANIDTVDPPSSGKRSSGRAARSERKRNSTPRADVNDEPTRRVLHREFSYGV